MEPGKRWSREELFLVMHLYCRIPFGRQHANAPEVIELALALGRTPGSVAMKLNNITSLDPEETARGVAGLSGASALDRSVWKEFADDWDAMAIRSERLWIDVMEEGRLEALGAAGREIPESAAKSETESATAGKPFAAKVPEGPTEVVRLTKARLAQGFFRRVVLASYGTRCCITGNPVPDLLEAAHIESWGAAETRRADPHNGLCLTKLHHAAFDRGLIAFDEKERLVLSPALRDFATQESIRVNFVAHEGRPLTRPERFAPDPECLRRHRETVFQSGGGKPS